jgi:MFS family permease
VPADTRRARRGWLHPTIVGVAGLAVLVGGAAFGVTAVLADVAVSFGEADPGTDEPVGLSATAIGIGLAIIRLAGAGSLIGAALADRHGRRRLVLLSVAGGLALTFVATTMPAYWAFVAVIALARPLLSTTNALAAVIAAEETSSADRSKAIAFVGAGYAAGAGIVSVMRGAFPALDFRAVLALAAAPVLLVPLIARRIEEPPVAAHATAAPLRRVGAMPRDMWARTALVCLLTAAIAVVTGPAFTYLFVYGENVLGLSAGTMAVIVLAAGPVGLTGLLLGRWAADRVGRRWTAGVTTALTAGCAVLAYSGEVATFAVGYLATITVAGAFGPAGGALVNEVFPTRSRGTANGWAAAAGVVGAVAGLALFGVLIDTFGGYEAAGRALWLPVLPLGALYVLLPETRGRELDEPIVTGG